MGKIRENITAYSNKKWKRLFPYPLDSLETVTFNEESTISENGRTISVAPIWKRLLKEE